MLAVRDKPSRRLFSMIRIIFSKLLYISSQSYLMKNHGKYENNAGESNLELDRKSLAHSSLNPTSSLANKRCRNASKIP
jgi:hypothetical protein